MATERTYIGLHHWYKHMVEKFGWVVIAMNNGDSEKVKHYSSRLEKLRDALAQKQGVLTEEDRKRDLHIMEKHINELIVHFAKFLECLSVKAPQAPMSGGCGRYCRR
jgi:hypothetical protein